MLWFTGSLSLSTQIHKHGERAKPSSQPSTNELATTFNNTITAEGGQAMSASLALQPLCDGLLLGYSLKLRGETPAAPGGLTLLFSYPHKGTAREAVPMWTTSRLGHLWFR